MYIYIYIWLFDYYDSEPITFVMQIENVVEMWGLVQFIFFAGLLYEFFCHSEQQKENYWAVSTDVRQGWCRTKIVIKVPFF